MRWLAFTVTMLVGCGAQQVAVEQEEPPPEPVSCGEADIPTEMLVEADVPGGAAFVTMPGDVAITINPVGGAASVMCFGMATDGSPAFEIHSGDLGEDPLLFQSPEAVLPLSWTCLFFAPAEAGFSVTGLVEADGGVCLQEDAVVREGPVDATTI